MSGRIASLNRTVLICCLGVLIIGINSTAIMTALPAIRHDLGLAEADIIWVVNAYLLAAAAGVMAGGDAGSRFGAVRVTICGFLLFALASAMIAMAPAPMWLLVGRALQGVAAALAVPGTLTAVGGATRPEARGSAMGAWAGCLLLGFSLGPVIGGALTHFVTWRAIFGLDGVAVLAATAYLLTVRKTAPVRTQGSFDVLGLVFLAAAMVAAILTLQSLSTLDRTPFLSVVWLALAVASLGLLWQRERTCSHPLISPALFGVRDLLPAVLVGATAMFCILPLLMVFNLHAQDAQALGLTPITAGLALLPMSASLLSFALMAPRLIQAFGFRRTVAAGLVLLIVSATVIALTAEHGSLAALCVGLFLAGAGLALPYAAAPRLALAAASPELTGQGSGFLNACTLLAGSAGVTLCGLAYRQGGLPLAMGVMILAALVGLAGTRRLPIRDKDQSRQQPLLPIVRHERS